MNSKDANNFLKKPYGKGLKTDKEMLILLRNKIEELELSLTEARDYTDYCIEARNKAEKRESALETELRNLKKKINKFKGILLVLLSLILIGLFAYQTFGLEKLIQGSISLVGITITIVSLFKGLEYLSE